MDRGHSPHTRGAIKAAGGKSHISLAAVLETHLPLPRIPRYARAEANKEVRGDVSLSSKKTAQNNELSASLAL